MTEFKTVDEIKKALENLCEKHLKKLPESERKSEIIFEKSTSYSMT